MAVGHDGPPAGTDFQIQQNVKIHAIIPLNPRHAHRDFPPTSLPRHWMLSVRTLQSHPPSQPVEIDQRPPSQSIYHPFLPSLAAATHHCDRSQVHRLGNRPTTRW
ncbi:hypothetical protein BDN71DRAFT_1456107 [Pleurotus eryngii]|uniref:Uncharacterized protein n=1 Tax=Pleurotus eryngii TaxID=5323 RepID=A0A9P5ZKK6_PLEER|nr:hypothetical protein BDN71DRAFT_1456107 [Pleurotus eryngii]